MLSIKSVINRYACVILIIIQSSAIAQLAGDREVGGAKDFSAVDAYFVLSERLQKKLEPTNLEWKGFFKSPINLMMISSGVLDTAEFKQDLRKVYSKSGYHLDRNDAHLEHHMKYKVNEKKLKDHILFLKSSNLNDSILKYLRPFLPDRLWTIQKIPKQYYIFYGSEEATGAPGMVICDLHLSSIVDNYRLGLLSAHETFHSIVTAAFSDLIKTPEGNYDPNMDLLYFLSNISQEGIADLIDKPLLSKKESPLKVEVAKLRENEVQKTINSITKLDSLLEMANGNFALDFYSLNSDYSHSGGHIPGRLMAQLIQDSGLLPQFLPYIADPIRFLELYNEALVKTKSNLPGFSKRTMEYLNDLKQKYYAPK